MRITHILLTALVGAQSVCAGPFLRGVSKVAGGAIGGIATYVGNTALGAYLNNKYIMNAEQFPMDENTIRQKIDEAGLQNQYTDHVINSVSPYVNKGNALTAFNIGFGTLLNHAFTGNATRKFSIPFYTGQAVAHMLGGDYLRHRNIDSSSQDSIIMKKFRNITEQSCPYNWEKSWNNVRNNVGVSGIIAALLRK